MKSLLTDGQMTFENFEKFLIDANVTDCQEIYNYLDINKDGHIS